MKLCIFHPPEERSVIPACGLRALPGEINEGGVVQRKLSQTVRTESEEDLLGLHDAAVSDLVSVGVPAGGGLLLVILHVNTAEFSCGGERVVGLTD